MLGTERNQACFGHRLSGEESMAQSVFLIYDVLEKPFARQLAIVLSLAGANVWLEELCADFRNPANRTSMLRRLINRRHHSGAPANSFECRWRYQIL